MEYGYLQIPKFVFTFLTEVFTVSRRYTFYIHCIAYIEVYIIDTLQHNRFSCVRSCFAFLFEYVGDGIVFSYSWQKNNLCVFAIARSNACCQIMNQYSL